MTSGALPGGLTLSSSGNISGTPNTLGSFVFDITATDAQGCTGVRSYTVTVSCPSIVLSPAILPDGIAHDSYSQTLTASSGTSPYSFSVTGGVMPPGLSLLSTGILSGTPTTIGSYTVMVTAIDANACQSNRSYLITVNCGAITISPLTLSNGSVGSPYSELLTADGGTNPYGFAVTSGSLPAGLTLSASGTLSGTPTLVGISSFTITATDAQGCSGGKAYSVTVDCPTIVLSPASLPNGVVGTSYSQTISGSGGTAPYSFSVTAGALPTGFTLLSSGLISGTPTLAGGFTFTITATDAQGCLNDHAYTVSINCPTITLSPSTLPNGIAGSVYTQTITASGGTAPYSFTVIADALPPGLTLSLAGLVSGTPSTIGTYSLTIRATDAQGCAGSRSYEITIDCPTINLAPTSLPHGTVGLTYNQTITPSGGTTPYTFSISSGSLPSGVTLSALGNLSGIPTTVGTYTFQILATDNQGCPGRRSCTLVIDCPVISMNPSSLPGGRVGVSYDHTITATGGTAPYGFAILSGPLPGGLTLLSSGAITGTPTTVGTFSFTVNATDVQGCTGSKLYAISIECPTIIISPSTVPDGTVGSSYLQTLTASGGTAPYSFAVTTGLLPGGLTLPPTGILSGTPTTAGIYSFTVTATDAQGCSGSRGYSVTMECPIITVNPATLSGGTAGTSYSQTISAGGGTAPYTFGVTSGSLPTGLTLSTAGLLTGTPSTVGTYTFTLTAADAQTCTGIRAYSVEIVCPVFNISPASLPHGIVNSAYNQSVTTGGGNRPYSFSLSSGGLPVGLTLSSAGSISGTPTTSGSSTFTLLVVDNVGCSGTKNYTIVIDAPGFSVLPSHISFGNVVVGSSKTDSLTVTNTGTSPLTISLAASNASEFTMFPSSGNLAVGAIKKFYVTFSPTSVGAKNTTVTFTHDASGSPSDVAIGGIGVMPMFSVSPTNVYYGNVNVGSTKPDSVTITNIGSSALTVSSVLSNNLQFAVNPSGVVLSPGDRQKYSVAFTPTSTGTKTGNVTFTHDASGSPGVVGLNGVGVIQGFTITPRVTFGNVVVGSSKQDSMTIVNTGTLTLNIASVTSTDPRFGVTPTNGSIPPGGNKKFFITFAPASVGLRTASIVYNHDAPGSPDSFIVSGTGVAPGFSFTPAQLQFANTIVGTSQIDSITVTNPGTSLLSISGVTSSNGMFSVIPTSGTILPAASRKFYIRFTPTALGAVSAVLSFAHDASGSPSSLPVSGTGTASIRIVKIRDSDGNAATTYDQSLKRWHLSLYRAPVSPANLLAEGDTSSLTLGVSEAGTYIACEADSGYPWMRINGNHTVYDTLSVAFGMSIADTFINVEQNTIVARVFEDADGDFQTTNDRVPKSWHMEVYQGTGPGGPLAASGTGASLSVPTLGDGSYFVRASDSSSWVPLGYLVNGIPT
ncbi:MAG: putative Ig domain-containing protein, partial [Ignavibacteriae bacterium]|nr:putative Ig domain-containing protein [Ignavibacteriota bacterium]